METGLYFLSRQLCKGEQSVDERSQTLKEFSGASGWQPIYQQQAGKLKPKFGTHLLVEHGVQSSAVLTFLPDGQSYSDFDREARYGLLGLAYNNLIDWQIIVERDRVNYVYVRGDTVDPIEVSLISSDNSDALRIDQFDKIVGRKPSSNVKPLDDSLMDTISYWKAEIIGAILSEDNINGNLSELFNAIIFCRAVEDHLAIVSPEKNIVRLKLAVKQKSSIGEALAFVLSQQEVAFDNMANLIEWDSLSLFDNLDQSLTYQLVSDFYGNRFAARYPYDFSVMSVHALSRIYERYMASFRLTDDIQYNLFGGTAEEVPGQAPGVVYTPQFIARFFSRYVQQLVPSHRLRNTKIIDPACGSGIFLRTILELLCDPSDLVSKESIKATFRNIYGYDVDQNAVKATKLSLALLHYVLTDEFPQRLNIHEKNTLENESYSDIVERFGLVVANPPYIEHDDLSMGLQQNVANILTPLSIRKPDEYMAFLKQAVSQLEPGGIALFVIPRPFLLNQSASSLRKWIHEQCLVLNIVDLSELPVFEKHGSYVILLSVQKKGNPLIVDRAALVASCRSFEGQMLQDILNETISYNFYYSVDRVNQAEFSNSNWVFNPRLNQVLNRAKVPLVSLSEIAQVLQGFVSGADPQFIVELNDVPQGAEDFFVKYLPDTNIATYSIKPSTKRVFFPYDRNGEKITWEAIVEKFPQLKQFLQSRRGILERRSPVAKGTIQWWEPARMRGHKMMKEKIVTPHLTLLPRFAYDEKGQYAVSRSPYISSFSSVDDGSLAYILAILNSDFCLRWLQSFAHKYGSGYLRLEVAQLKDVPIPKPILVEPVIYRRIVSLVRENSKALALDDSTERSELRDLLKGILPE